MCVYECQQYQTMVPAVPGSSDDLVALAASLAGCRHPRRRAVVVVEDSDDTDDKNSEPVDNTHRCRGVPISRASASRPIRSISAALVFPNEIEINHT